MQTLRLQPVSPPSTATYRVKLDCVPTNCCDEALAYIHPERYSQVTGQNRAVTTVHLTAYPATVGQERAAS